MHASLSQQLGRRAVLGAGLCFGAFGLGRGAFAAPNAERLVAAARRQVGVTLSYDTAYSVLPFPGGDVDRAKGVCTDVIIRAYRDALGIDLQALVNADMKRDFAAYPRNWGLRRPDRNIDHRRVPNLAAYWTRQRARLPVSTDPADWRPGDIFTSMTGGRFPHTGIVSDRTTAAGRPLVIHKSAAARARKTRSSTTR